MTIFVDFLERYDKYNYIVLCVFAHNLFEPATRDHWLADAFDDGGIHVYNEVEFLPPVVFH